MACGACRMAGVEWVAGWKGYVGMGIENWVKRDKTKNLIKKETT